MAKYGWQITLMEQFQGQSGNALVRALTEIAEDGKEVEQRFENRLEVIERSVEKVESAFPDKDFAGHCIYHEMIKEDVRSRKALTQAVKEKLVVVFLIMTISWIGGAVWLKIFSSFSPAIK